MSSDYERGMRPNADLPQWDAPECRFANNGMRPERARLHLAQGIALGYTEGGLFALKGQKPSTHIKCFCPYRANDRRGIDHRALPWAMSFWAFSPIADKCADEVDCN